MEGQSAGAIAPAVEERHAAPERRLVVAAEEHGAPDQASRHRSIGRRFRGRPRSAGPQRPQPRPLAGHPFFQLGRGVRDKDAIQKVAAIALDRHARLPTLQRGVEPSGV